ncbi:hypothetical protein [Kitasatospora sp. KL5]|uniref:hypothetical protein n=1 Tax=Kitasatospora sp. KL5 TaxID=3425125 RepID=UPI003D6EFEDA
MRTLLAALAVLAAATPSAAARDARPAGPDAALVDGFLHAYRDAVLGLGDNGLTPSEVRAEWLAPELNRRLDDWQARHGGTDPVFRAGTPDSWTVHAEGGAAGLGLVGVAEHRPGGPDRCLRYTVRDADRTVADLRDSPACTG